MTPAHEFTVEQAAALLGVDRHRVIRLIVEGRLPWTMSKDGATVLVEVPREGLSPEDHGTPGPPGPSPRAAAPHAGTRSSTTARDGDPFTISDVDAWSKPR